MDRKWYQLFFKSAKARNSEELHKILKFAILSRKSNKSSTNTSLAFCFNYESFSDSGFNVKHLLKFR